eukprot:SAG31_NODE_938_length_10882_cov_18.550032_1_plen_106_part_00
MREGQRARRSSGHGEAPAFEAQLGWTQPCPLMTAAAAAEQCSTKFRRLALVAASTETRSRAEAGGAPWLAQAPYVALIACSSSTDPVENLRAAANQPRTINKAAT